MQNLFFIVLIGFVAWIITAGKSTDQYPSTSEQTISVSLASPSPVAAAPAPPSLIQSSTISNFRCDGRQYCSQMATRDEAIFFINNCPNTKMDGDNDGDPCENDSRFKKNQNR